MIFVIFIITTSTTILASNNGDADESHKVDDDEEEGGVNRITSICIIGAIFVIFCASPPNDLYASLK